MYQKILVAIDGSNTSDNALAEAIKLAETGNGELLVLYVADESFIYHGGPGFDGGTLMALTRQDGEKILNKAKKILEKHPNVKFTPQLYELRAFQGRVAQIIVEQATEWDADLIVLGTHGRRGFSRFILGSVAENALRLSSIPVLMIKGDED